MGKYHNLFFFTVRGVGPFPFHLLALDECWPARDQDAERIPPGAGEPRTVLLKTRRIQSPSIAAWHKVGWLAGSA